MPVPLSRVVAFAAAALIVSLAPGRADAAWTQLQTPNFLLIGDASEGRIREVAERLESFRTALQALLPSTGARPVRTVVFVFGSDRSFAPYRPLFNGKPIEVGGFFQRTRDRAFIALGSSEDVDVTIRTIYHEYSHHMMDGMLREVPVWANEGLAELYQTIEISRDRRSVLLGNFEKDHIYVLRSSTLMPVRQLASVTHASPVYNEGNRRGVFYAQSWALAHYLMFGSDERHAQFERYLTAVHKGAAPEGSFLEIFGDDKVLDSELSQYVKRAALPATRIELTQQLAVDRAVRGQPIHESEVEGYLGELLAGMGRLDDARAHFERALQRRADAVVPAIGRANLAMRDKQHDDAIRLFEEVAGRAPDHFDAQIGLGRALFAAYSEAVDNDQTLLSRARAPLGRAVSLDASSAEAAAMLGFVEIRTAGDLARAVQLLEKAIELAPSREEYRLYLADALVRQRDFTRATSYLGPLMGSGSTQQIRDLARALLSYVANLRAAAASGPSAATAAAPPDLRTAAPRDTNAGIPIPGAGPRTPRIILELRPVTSGEEQVLGMFTGVECQATGIALLVQAPTTLRLRASTFDQVAFISYRSDTSTVQCGTLPSPQRVLATFRRQASGTLDAVAIELLPDGYDPPN